MTVWNRQLNKEKKMRVLLIQPPMFKMASIVSPNLGLAYIAAVLERDGIEVKVVDSAAERITYDEIIEHIRQFRPHIIGSGGQTPVSPHSLTIFRRTKREISPDIVTLAGGPHFTFTDRESLEECPELDIVVRGEAEETIRQVCQELKAGESLQGVSGITWRNEKGQITCNQDRELIPDLDSIPFPAWHLFPVEKYQWMNTNVIGISSARGCPYRCPHCITWKVHKGVRRRNPAKIVEEMIWVKRNFNIDTFFFHDDVSFLIREQLEGFLEELEACGERFYWWYETREDVLLGYRDLWKRMKKKRADYAFLGLETPDPEIRRYYGKKGYDVETVDRMIDTFEKELDVLISVYMIFGVPDDTEKSMEDQIKYAKHLYPDRCSLVIGSLAVPFPGTEMYKQLKAKNMITSFDWKDYGFGKSVIKTSVPPEKILKIFNGFWIGTFVRPKALVKQFINLFSRNRFRKGTAKSYFYTAITMMKLRGKQDSTP